MYLELLITSKMEFFVVTESIAISSILDVVRLSGYITVIIRLWLSGHSGHVSLVTGTLTLIQLFLK